MKLTLFNELGGDWEASKGYIKENFEHIQLAINNFLGKTFDGTTLKAGGFSIEGNQADVPQYISNTGTANGLKWDRVNLVTGVQQRLQFLHFVAASAQKKLVGRGAGAGGDFQEIVLGTSLDMTGTTLNVTTITESQIVLSDVTTDNVSSTAHGFAPKSPADATKFLNGAATPAYAQVKDSDLSTSDITTNDVSITKHGFAPKAPNDANQYLNGLGAFATIAWTSIGFNAANFTGSGAMTWTLTAGDQSVFDYVRIGNVVIFNMLFITTTVGGVPDTYLQVAIPFTATHAVFGTCLYLDNSTTSATGIAQVGAGSSTIQFSRDFFGTVWTASVNNTHVGCQLILNL